MRSCDGARGAPSASWAVRAGWASAVWPAPLATRWVSSDATAHGAGRGRVISSKAPARTQPSISGASACTPDTGAALLGVQDFLTMLPELSLRRAWLQSRRVRSDAEVFAGFDGRWTAAVPSAHGDLHARLRTQVMAALGVR